MVNVREDLTGRIFGRLKVLKQVEDYISPNGVHYAQWLCECSCPEHNQRIVLGKNLTKKKNGTSSCGCLIKERLFLTRKKYNNVQLDLEDDNGKYGIGYCSNTGKEFYFDMNDYKIIKDYTWYEDVDDKGYSRLRAIINGKRVTMSNFLGYKWYDHADRNPMNNRRYNFREATFSENNINQSKQFNNTSGYIGVSWNKFTNKWVSYININKKQTSLGSYENKKDAIIARLNAEAKYYGEFAPQKYLFEEYGIL